MGPLHVLIDQGDGKHEVEVKGVDHVGNHTDSNGQGCVLEVSWADIHRAELDAPSDLAVLSGRVLEAKRVPVGRLEVLEVLVARDGRALQEPGGAQLGQLLVLFGSLGEG